MDVIVTDHHQCPRELPPALAVINPKRSDSSYPYKKLAGVGVVHRLSCALETVCRKGMFGGLARGEFFSDYMLDLVALGTVADIVPLTGENRVLVSLGLKKMAATNNIGLKALIRSAGIKDGQISSGQVAFALAPRLNAAGRLADAQKGVRLLLTDDEETASMLAKELDARNRERQKVEDRILQNALEMAERCKEDGILVLASEKWHPGVIGIAASRVVEKHNKPAILFSIDGDEARGSARSIPGLDLYELLSRYRHYYKSFGGHKQAAGLTVETGSLDKFAREINDADGSMLREMETRPVIRVDGDLTGITVSTEDAKSLKLLEPCGCGNPPPLFVKRRVGIAGVKRVGKGREHLKLLANDGSARLDCIAFRWEGTGWPVAGQRPDMVFTPQVNKWLGRENLQLVVKDLRDLSKKEAFLKSWYKSMLDLNRHGALSQGKNIEPAGTDVIKTDCGYEILRDALNKSTGNLVLVNGYADVLDAFSILLLHPNVAVRFGSLGRYSADSNYIIVHPSSFEGMEDCRGRIYFFGHSVLPMQLEAVNRLKENERVMLADRQAVSLGLELLSLVPGRDTLVTIYGAVKRHGGLCFDDLLRAASRKGISAAAAVLSVESLKAFNLVAEKNGTLVLMPAPPNKVNLGDAPPIKTVKAIAMEASMCYETVKKSIYDV